MFATWGTGLGPRDSLRCSLPPGRRRRQRAGGERDRKGGRGREREGGGEQRDKLKDSEVQLEFEARRKALTQLAAKFGLADTHEVEL